MAYQDKVHSEDIISLIAAALFVIATAAVLWFSASTGAQAGSDSQVSCGAGDACASFDSQAKEYQAAIYAAMSPSSKEVSQALFKFDRPTVFVTWTKAKWVDSFKPSEQNPAPLAGTDIWVTDAYSMKKFCQDFARSHPGKVDALNLRLKQRLGLPPDSAADWFVELRVDPAKPGGMFRPCEDPSVRLDGSTCAPSQNLPSESEVWKETPQATRDARLKEWTLQKYHNSFASAKQYPWTELGYTFDWARAQDGSGQFVRRGQSEFVIPKGDPVNFVLALPTVAYCTPQ